MSVDSGNRNLLNSSTVRSGRGVSPMSLSDAGETQKGTTNGSTFSVYPRKKNNHIIYQKLGKLDPLRVSQFVNTTQEGDTDSVQELLAKQNSSKEHLSTVRREKTHEVESFMLVNCAKHVQEPQRGSNIMKAIDDLGKLYPSLSGIFLTLRRYVKDVTSSIDGMQQSHNLEIKHLEEKIYEKHEKFFEEKILQLIRDKRKAESVTKQLRDEILKLRKERDEDLMKVKETVMTRLNDCERKEDEFTSFRKLIASVFKTNEGLVNRVEDLETLLRKHRIDIPRVNEDLYTYSKPKNENSSKARDADDVKKVQDQVPISFMEASRKEMNLARLSLQRELLNSAFDDRTAYRLQVNGLRNENSALQMQIESLQSQVMDLERYIHEKRFLAPGPDETGIPLTPRPRDIPFAVQTDLGIDLKKSTAEVLSELAAVGTNLKHQLNSAVMTLRQLSSIVEWIENETMLKSVDQSNARGVLPTFSTAIWDTIPHFLRTYVQPDVPNLKWTSTEVASILFDFFSNYFSLRKSCRFTRDSKMLTPRVYQLFERCQNPLVRLDASTLEIQQSEDNVPFGYVVSYFIAQTLKKSNSDHGTNLLQPGTLNPAFLYNGKSIPVEMEFGKYAYNLWYSAQYYKEEEPLCHLFVDIVDGRLPINLFEMMQKVLRVVEARLRKYDVDGSNSFTYNKLVSSVLKLVADMDAQIGRCAILAVMETFRSNNAPLIGGRIFIPAILADESCVEKDSPKLTRHRSIVGMRIIRKGNIVEQPDGASVLTRFWRRLIIRRHEEIYSLLEKLLGPLVVESQVVIGLFLLPIPSALDVVKEFDENGMSISEDYLASRNSLIPMSSQLSSVESTQNTEAPEVPRFTDRYVKMLAERRTLTQDFKGVSLERFLTNILEGVQRLSRSVHFPFNSAQQTEVSSVPQPSLFTDTTKATSEGKKSGQNKEGGGNKKKNKSKVKGKKKIAHSKTMERRLSVSSQSPVPEAVPEDMTLNSDREMVEWYGFCATMRQSVFLFSENIFLEEPTNLIESITTVVESRALPVLLAEEASPCESNIGTE
ncbi:uncharacterized protein TM35_000191390 [Trypanosoma theileri]|uniref:Uncharacterized protein n=1 Tax=Trypanosoma theileri TaxID=67003 RepID=A0A1X0NT65_9TRYP|nr:uncharacterized protein TM35_000191390 [Trypanosoma theileri]ORC87895.1 hypothetical protein TM35_000191390 [Trypanosoma theileri]